MDNNKYYMLWIYFDGMPFLWKASDEIGQIENEIDYLKSHAGKISFGPYDVLDIEKCVVTNHLFEDLIRNPIESVNFKEQED